MNKNNFVVGFMLFAIFFGAGNLIFPPKLGLESGTSFWPAILGFVITGVGLPLLGIIISAFYSGGYKNALMKIHPWFSIIFLSAIYLTIGPFFAIPRTATTSYELTIQPFLNEPSTISLFIFTAVYFFITLWISLNPSKMVERIGSILTPVLLIAILALIIKAILLLSGDATLPAPKVETASDSMFFNGFVEGYLTMDAIASIAFSVIVLNAIKSKGVESNGLVKQTAIAGLIAAVFLGAIYIALAWIGNNISISAETLADINAKGQNIGTYILNTIALDTFGSLGRSILGLIVTLACLTTAIGLVVAVSEYFNEIFPKISYKIYVIIFTLFSFIISNQGLNFVISKSIPVLLVLYPIAMTVILLLLINRLFNLPLIAQRLSVILVTIISICSVAKAEFIHALPLVEYSMEWLPFALAGIIVGTIIGKVVNKV